MKITKSQAQKLKKYGFKWYKSQCTARVEPESIKEIRPSSGGFTVIYRDVSNIAFVASIAKVTSIEWREDPSKEWIYVHYSKIKDVRRV